MSEAEILQQLRLLPKDKQAEVFDFLEYLVGRFGKADAACWTETDFAEFSFGQALRGMEDDPVVYRQNDIRHPWQ